MKYKIVTTTLATLLTLSGATFALQQATDKPASGAATTTQATKDTKPAKAASSSATAVKSSAKPHKPVEKPKPPKPPWQEFKLNPKSKLFLDFTDSNPDMVISIFSRTSGITIVKDPTFKSTLTVTSAKSVGLDEAFSILNTVLGMNGFELQKKDNMLLVAKKAPPAPPTPPTTPPQAPPQPTEEKVVLKIYHLQNASATQVARVVNEVFSQQSLEQMVQQLQQGGGFQGPPGMGMGMGMGGGRPQPPKVVRASSDEYGNTVVVNAPEKFQADIQSLITELDKSSDQPLESEIFKLKYVNVDDVVDAIQNVLSANTPTGRGAGKPQDNTFNPYMSYYSFGSSRSRSNSNGQTAVAVKPTNSVIVSATKENMEIVKKLIDNLDQEADYVGTTTVIHLENAKASDVATLLNSAFTKRRDQSGYDNPYFFIYSDGFDNQKKSDITTDVTEDGQVVNVRDLSGKVNIMADPNTNSLIVVTLPSNIKLIRKIVDQIDRISDQVMIETVIVEASLDKKTKLGVEWNFLNNSGNLSHSGNTDFNLQTSTDPLRGFKYTLTGPDYKVFVNALATDSRYKVLSTPRIFTSNNVKAEINVSQKVPYITSQQASNNSTGNLISNYDFKDVGVILTVTPRITSTGDVSMDVVQSADDLQGYTDYNAPIINHRQAQTTATVKDGETIILGGIIRNTTNLTQSKVPLLGDLPLLGHLFRSTERSQGQTELMVLLTPHIVRNNGDAQKLRSHEQGQLSKQSQDAIEKMVPPAKP